MQRIYFFQPQRGYYVNGTVSYYLPYSVGCLWAYANQHPDIQSNYTVADFVFKREDIGDLLNRIDSPDIAVFSCYIWNWEYNKKVAELIKQRWPNCFVLFGGPQVTNKPLENSFFKNHHYVDCVINGEGEIAFQQLLLDRLKNIRPAKIIPFTRLTELDYPSPYTSGVFDQIMTANPDYSWQAVLETNRGCPYACTFCDWGSLTYSKVLRFSEQKVMNEITWFSDKKIEYMVLADANFGILHQRDKMFAKHLNDLQTKTGYPVVCIASWAKNAKEQIINIAKIFFANGKNRGFTLSLQSMDDAVLEAIKRKNMDINNLSDMLKLCVQEKIPTYTEMILGLPYETQQSWRENLSKLMTAGQHNAVDVYFTSLLENSELNTTKQRHEHDIKYLCVPTGINGTSGADNLVLGEDQEVPEYEYIITSTRYMSFDDLVESYMFSHVVLTYHYGGWTQQISRFLHRYHGITYLDFYTRLENYIKSSNGVMNQKYHQIKTFITEFLSGNYNFDSVMRKDFHNALWRGVPALFEHQDQLFEKIFEIFDVEYCNLDQSLYDQLKQFQIDSMYTFAYQYPMVKNFDYNFPDYIGEKIDQYNQPCKITFEYAYTWHNREEFLEKAYFDRRKGVLKTKYSSQLV